MTGGQLFRLLRPPTLAATLAPVAVGTAAALAAGPVRPALVLDMLAVGMLLQVATNVANEYGDYRYGVDHGGSVGIAGVIVSGEVPPRTVARLGLALYLLAFVLGLPLAWARGLWLLLPGVLGIAMGVFYTAGPLPISRTPFGEVAAALFMGPLEIVCAEVAAGGRLTSAAWVASPTVALLVGAILLANNLRDRESDGLRGRRTLPVLLGPVRGYQLLCATVALAIVWPLLGAALQILPLSVLLVLLAVPLALRGLSRLREERLLRRAVPIVAGLHLSVSLLLAAALALR